MKEIVESMEGNSIILESAKKAIDDENIVESLCIISSNYMFLAKLIESCESINFSISMAFEIIKNFKIKDHSANILTYISKRIVNFSKSNISPLEYSHLMNCQASSATVERSFSLLKKILKSDRNFASEKI